MPRRPFVKPAITIDMNQLELTISSKSRTAQTPAQKVVWQAAERSTKQGDSAMSNFVVRLANGNIEVALELKKTP